MFSVIIIDYLCSFVSLVTSSIIGPIVGGVIGGFNFVITVVVICCIAAIVIRKHHKSHVGTSNSQQIELRYAATIQSNTPSHPLAQQPPPSYLELPPAVYHITLSSNTIYPDQEITVKSKTLRVHPPPSYTELYNN